MGNDGVSGVEIDGDKGLANTSGIVGTDPSFCFFLISYTYLTSPEFESQHIQVLALLHHFLAPQ
jgi:hypothetical protein